MLLAVYRNFLFVVSIDSFMVVFSAFIIANSLLLLLQFEDVAWDEFCLSADHIAPDPGFQRPNDRFTQGDNHKKRHCEITSTSSNTGDGSAATYVDQGREQGGYLTLTSKRRNTMLEEDACSHATNVESIKEASISTSDNTRSSSHGLKSNNTDSNDSVICDNDAILGDKSVAVDNNSFSCPLTDITHTGNNLDFFENAENKDSTDFLHYGWPEIGNFEDIDGMFRGSDSAFGLGVSEEDELGWFSSADDIGDVLKSDFKFPCLEPNMVKNISQDGDSSKAYSMDGSAITSGPIRYEDTSSVSGNSDMYMSFAIGPPTASKDGFIPKEQGVDFNGKIQPGIPTNSLPRTGGAAMMNEHGKQLKLKSRSDGQSKDHYLRNGSFNHVDNLPNEVIQLPSAQTSHQAFVSVRMHQHQHPPGPDSYCYLQNPISYVHSDDSHLSDPSLVNPTAYTVKSEPNDLISPSPRGSAHRSSQLQSVDSSHEPPFQVTTLAGYEKGEKLCNHRGIQSSMNSRLRNTSAMVQASICDPGSVGKLENHSDTEGVRLDMLSELDSSNVQEKTRSSGLDEISQEAAGFHQLQHVMERLDLKTKLCIRDSLYRLARSAELRHNLANGSGGDERDASGSFVAEGTNKAASFMDIETDTNPIDRSIAHLLFHRSSVSLATPGPRVSTKSACNG
ncbi:hypothetical protein BUALT_Bualt19G0095300 [Buddleja alternifolia]|uniref:Protein LNK1 n=1 Tax=Buddleja alternifolia TaxID=168488 RepID=A0AAV6WB19_9LAMI|nr:hypothetical protein BUALT_Bualt19G0095300 [Buddleja alternifolia]